MKHRRKQFLSILLSLALLLSLIPAMASVAFADGADIASVRTAIQALSADPTDYTASNKDDIEAIQADFESLSPEDQATLDAECTHSGTGQSLGRVLESALWAVHSFGTDIGTTLSDGTYTTTTDPAVSSVSSKGKSDSSRTRNWWVESVVVENGKATAYIYVTSGAATASKLTSYPSVWTGGSTIARNSDNNYPIPVDLNGTTYFGGISSSMPTPIMYSLNTTIEEPLGPVSYMDWDGSKLVKKTGDEACKDYTVVTADTTFENNKWYVVSGNVTLSNDLNAEEKTIHLILCDDCSLTAGKGIGVYRGSLTVYAGSTGETIKGTGALTVQPTTNAAVDATDGAMTVNGGVVNLASPDYYAFEGSTLTVNGGIFTATTSGYEKAVSATVINNIAGVGWTNAAGSGAGTPIDRNTTGTSYSYKKIQFPVFYPVWVGGVQVNESNKGDVLGDGTVSYTPAVADNPQTDENEAAPATLTLNGAEITTSYTDPAPVNLTYGIYSNSAEPLSIVLAPGSVNSIRNVAQRYGIYTTGALSISGDGSLTTNGTDAGINSPGSLVISGNGSITATATGEGSRGIHTTNITISGGTVEASGKGFGIDSDITIAGGAVTATGGAGAIIGTVKNAIAGVGWTNKDGTGTETPIEPNNTGTSYNFKKIQFGDFYPVWVGGTQVTSANKGDVLGDGTVSYTPAVADNPQTDENEATPATLTLNGYNNGGSVYQFESQATAAIYAKEVLTIDLTGENTVVDPTTVEFHSGNGIYATEDLTIRGTGTLTAQGSSYGIRSGNVLTIESGTVTGKATDDTGTGIGSDGIMISGGTVNAEADYYGIESLDTITIENSIVKAKASVDCIYSNNAIMIEGSTVEAESSAKMGSGLHTYNAVIIKGSTVTVSAAGEYGTGVYTGDSVTIDAKSKVTVIGDFRAFNKAVKNDIAGTGWTDVAGKTGKATIEISSADGQMLTSFKKVMFPAFHEHSFAYAVGQDTNIITAYCIAEDCTVPPYSVTVTLTAPEKAVYDGKAKPVTVTLSDDDPYNIVGDTAVSYYVVDGDTKTKLDTVPVNAGTYRAELTLGDATAYVVYEIAQAEPTVTAPNGLTATVGQTLADVTLTNPEGNTPGAWKWNDPPNTSVGSAGTNTFKATFTPTDDNYSVVDDVDVSVTVVAKKYQLTVEYGTASPTQDYYTESDTITITANDPETGMVFDKWETDAYVIFVDTTKETNAVAKIQIRGDATVTAKYKAAPPVTPTITTQPKDLSWTCGDATARTLTIAASITDTGSLSYQWFRGGTADFTPGDDNMILGATDASYSIPSPQTAEPGVTYYKCLVTNTKDGQTASVTSSAATVTVSAAEEQTYTLTVVNGTIKGGGATGAYVADADVTIVADEPESGKVFKEWKITYADDAYALRLDVTAKELQFNMPATDMTAEATYENAPAATYTLTVENGSGSGEYEAGAEVTIKANTPETGKVFDKWVSDDYEIIADANSATTTVTMPAKNATVKATYKDAPSTGFTLTVVNGTASPEQVYYTESDTITITANAPAAGKVFKEWTADNDAYVTFADATSATTTIHISGDVTVTATYKDAPAAKYALTVVNGTGGGEYAEGTEVTIKANDPAEGMEFDKWVIEGFTPEDDTAAEITFRMPANAVTATATYKNAPVYGGTGSSAPYKVNLPAASYGTITATPATAAKGTKVTLKLNPADGFTAVKPTVLDKDGKPVEVTDNGDGTYSFTMPDGEVTVKGGFKGRFVDVEPEDWFFDAVYWAAAKGITLGTDETHFTPGGECTRAMFVTFLWRAAGEPAPTTTECPFEDVLPDAYYYNAVLWAAETGVTLGTDETHFTPDRVVTRAEAFTFVYRYEKLIGKGFTGMWAFSLADFPDHEDVPEYAYEAFCWMIKEGKCQGCDGQLLPNAVCPRSQVVTLLIRVFG